MKRLFIIPVLLLTLLIANPAFSADFQKGVDASEQGDASTQNKRALEYYFRKKDYKTAVKWWSLAAEQGHSDAQNSLGIMYNQGKGVPQDYITSIKWYTLAAEQGHPSSASTLGGMYKSGFGAPQDYKIAVKWYTLAVEQSYNQSFNQWTLGKMYKKGQGVPQDYKAAVKWFTLAAEQGDDIAQSLLGDMYLNGEGVLQDYTRAHMWFNLASIDGEDEYIKKRNLISKKMSPSQIETAQRLARECVKKNYKGCGE
jgi:uncharacterized protein